MIRLNLIYTCKKTMNKISIVWNKKLRLFKNKQKSNQNSYNCKKTMIKLNKINKKLTKNIIIKKPKRSKEIFKCKLMTTLTPQKTFPKNYLKKLNNKYKNSK